MNVKYFIDTNIIVYGFDDRQPDKKARSLSLITDALQTGNGVISWQVVQEFLNVATRKFKVPLKPEDAKLYLQKVLHPLCQVFPDLEIYQDALNLQVKTNYSFYDSLILAGAMREGCTILYSEDLQDGYQVDGLRIVNPFN
jgi:predicted nucleic acid-binding protein